MEYDDREVPIPPVPDRAIDPPESFEPGPVEWVKDPKTFTTQRIPSMVFAALKRIVGIVDSYTGEMGVEEGVHVAVRIHPRDWQWLKEYLHQQGKYDPAAGPLNSLEVDGVTILEDVGAKVPHLELSVE